MNTWWVGHILGAIGVTITFLDWLSIKDIFEGLPIAFRYSIAFFSLIYIMFQSLRAYERWQKDRLENEKTRIELRKARFEADKIINNQSSKTKK